MTSKLDFSSNNEAAHCPENCCCQTFDWKLFSRCHHESLCQNLFVCKDCRASDNSSLLTTLHRKCQHCVTLFVTRTSSSNHQVKLLTHQTPKEFKVPVCGRSLKTNEAPEEMFDFFFPFIKWNESVLCSLITQPEFFFLSADIIFLEPTGKFGANCDSKDSKAKCFVLIWLMFWSLSLVENDFYKLRIAQQKVWSSVIWLHAMIAKWNKFRGFWGLSNLWGLDSFHLGDHDEL